MYITPRVLIQQEFVQLPVYAEFPLPAFILGPHYALTRYSEATERPFAALNTLDGELQPAGNSYVANADTTYSFSNIPAGGNVDPSYTKVYVESVEAKYFPNTDLNTSDIEDAEVAGIFPAQSGNAYINRVILPNVTLKTANGYDRSACFSNRDVAVGDVIQLTDNLANVTRARITGLHPVTSYLDSDLESTIANITASGTDGVTNGSKVFTSASADFVASEVVGKYITIRHIKDTPGVFKIIACTDNHTLVLDRNAYANSGRIWSIGGVYNGLGNTPWECVDYNAVPVSVGVANSTVNVTNTSTGYVGYSSKGIVRDTYTVTVTSGTTEENVKFSISSANGAFATKTNVSLGEALVVDDNNGNGVYLTFIGDAGATGGQYLPMEFAVGNSWTVGELIAAVEPVTPAVDGTYTGAIDATYTLRVDRGGAFYDGTNASSCARVVITSSNVDASTVVLPEIDTYFNVGSRGVVAAFEAATNNGGLILGDTYYIPVTAEKAGPVRIVEFSESLSEATLQVADSMTAEFFLVQASIQIPEVRDLALGTTNWSQDGSYITINSDITTYENNLLSSTLEPARLPVATGKLFAEHRDLLQDFVNSIDSVRSLADINLKLGVVHPDNPLAQGVYDAVLNAQNTVVYFIAVATDDLAGYNGAIKISEKSDKVYSFAPMTFDKTIQDAVVSHVNAYSTAEVGRWRIAWIAAEDKKSEVIYDLKENGSAYQGTITDDPASAGTQNRLVTIEGAQMLNGGSNPTVRPNDSVRINFKLSAGGAVIYDEYTVDRVLTNTTLVLTRSLSSPISAPTNIQIVRNYTKSERASNIAAIAGGYNNRRVRVVFPDTYKYGNVVKQGFFAAAGLAGLRSGVVPHQGLTNTEFLGADDLSKVVVEFSVDDLNTMAEQGVWLITQEVIGATPYVRHQLTSDTNSLNTSEDSITTNADNISYALKKTLTPYIGRYNVNPNNVLAVYAAVVNELRFRATNTRTERAGNQLTSFTPADDILNIAQNETYKDSIDVEVRLNVPYPLNYINLKLVVA